MQWPRLISLASRRSKFSSGQKLRSRGPIPWSKHLGFQKLSNFAAPDFWKLAESSDLRTPISDQFSIFNFSLKFLAFQRSDGFSISRQIQKEIEMKERRVTSGRYCAQSQIRGFLTEEYVREARRVAHQRGTRKVSRDEEATRSCL